MTPEQILLVQDTFDTLLPSSDAIAQQFYQRLFDLNPTVRAYFPTDMRLQQDMLMAMINTVVHGLWHIDTLVPVLQQLGQRHASYGTQTAHYDLVGAALLWTLRQGLGAQFTAEVEAAWATAYTFIAATMLTGVGQAAEAPESLLEP